MIKNRFKKMGTSERDISQEAKELEFNKFIVSEYLKYGSVDQVFSKNGYNLPVSYPNVHRIINKWGIMKAVGPNSKLSEAICFLMLLSDNNLPIERVYKCLPPSFKTSLSTIHRIMHLVKEGAVRRYGAALMITPEDNPQEILAGEDVSTPRVELGKPFGSLSLPMGYCKANESAKDSILRILQHEVFTQKAIDKTLPLEIISEDIKPFMYFDIVDVRVAVYNLSLSSQYSSIENFESFKLREYRYLDLEKITGKGKNLNFRYGIREMAKGYEDYLLNYREDIEYIPQVEKSLLNQEVLAWALGYNK